jgi:hypothetical protein
VQAVQTGAFISNFSDSVQVFTGYGIAQPQNFILRTPPVYLRPFYVMLNWDVQSNSGVVDHWEIQRCAVNNIAANRLNLNNPADFANLVFTPFRTVYLESSRFSSKVQDQANSTQITSSVIVGQNYYQDSNIDFGNTYFYRIQAVDPQGNASPWSYKGMKITSAAFEKTWMSTLTDVEKAQLAVSYTPLAFINGRRPTPLNNLSIQPDYSKPSWNRAAPLASYVVSE